jgi:YidC/Oxa1 family membrane protein insertase
MEKRVLLAVILSFAVLYGYQVLFPPPPEPPKTAQSTATDSGKASTARAPSTNPQAPPSSAAANAAAPAASSAPATPPPAGPAGRDIVMDTADVHAVFTTRGGALKSWVLKHYQENGQQLDFVAAHAPTGSPLPFTLSTDDPAVASKLQSAMFTASSDHVDVSSGNATLTFEYQDGAGLTAAKTFRFARAQPYVIDFTATVTQNGKNLPLTVEWGPALGTGVVPKSRSYNPPPQPIYYRDGKVTRVAEKKVGEQPVVEGSFGFAGVDDHYFIAALVAPKQPVRLDYRLLDVNVPGEANGAHYVTWSARYQNPPKDARYFAGPKDFDIMAAVDRDLVRSIDFGIFSWLVVPLLRALKWLNGYIGNFGWSLVVLTILINLVMFPLRHKSVVSMRRMQEIQPEMKAIQDRYANLKMSDPARSKMNTELMNLYRERGVNPASGCIPMLLTFPVLFAFYALLSVAIELRGAPFILWIHDLVAPDPYYVLPILMGVTMFAQQRMTPSTADPTQQKMMLIMPVVFTGMSLWWSSGLLLYWTVSNIWGIGQQMITNRIIGKPKVRAYRPPAERRVKRGGAEPAKERK